MNSQYRGAGYAGIIGTLIILFSLLSAVWGLNDPSMNFFWWAVYTIIWTASLSFAVALGFRLNVRTPLRKDVFAAGIGFVSGIFTVGSNLLAGFINPAFSYTASESVWLVMLAPVSETFLFIIVIYEVFDFYLQGVDWLNVAIVSDISFVGYHYFKYFAQNQALAPLLIILILTVGNTLFVYIYHVTKNATAPIVSHTTVNFASQRAQVIQAFINAVPALVSLFAIIIVIYVFVKTFRRYS